MKTVLVTGGAGFIGSCFVRRLLSRSDWRVIVLDKLTYAGSLDALQPGLEQRALDFERGAVEDASRVSELLALYRPEAIVHFAAESHVDRSIDAPAEFVMTNVVGTFQLLESARNYYRELSQGSKDGFRLVHVSTDEVYGAQGPQGAFAEGAAYAPNSPYSASKAASDHFARAYFRTYGLPVITTHCTNNFGPYQFPEKLVPLMILNAWEGKSLPVYGDGQHVRNWIYVEDCCRGIERVLEAGGPGQVYNIGGAVECTNREMVHSICRCVDVLRPDLPHCPTASLIEFVADRPGHDRRYALDSSKIERELGWRPEADFQSALHSTVAWYLEHLPWVEQMSRGAPARRRQGLERA